jgi:hypothetical protein
MKISTSELGLIYCNCFLDLTIYTVVLSLLRNVALSDQNSDSDASTDSQSEIDEADRVQQEENKNPVSAAAYQSSSPVKKDRVGYQ